MQEDPQNYGRSREPGDPESEPYGRPQADPRGDPYGDTTRVRRAGATGGTSEMSPQDERTWSMLSHLSVLVGLFGLMPLGALLVWLLYRDRSERVRFHAAQAFWYQLSWLVILAAGWAITVVLSFVLIGLLLIPVMLVASLIPFVHGCYAAYKVNGGEDYRYPFIADRVDGGARSGL